jgi:hypothetical protein
LTFAFPLIIREKAARILGSLGAAAAGAVAVPTALWHASNRAVRLAAAFAGAAAQTIMETLQRIGPAAKGGVPALAEKARDKNRLVSESARTALKEIGPAL